MIRLLPLLALCSGCVASRGFTLGVAVWPFVIGTETRIDELTVLRGVEVVVCVMEVAPDYVLAQIPVSGAQVTVYGPGFDEGVDAVALIDGVYAVDPIRGPELAYEPGAPYRVEVVVDGETYVTEAPAASPLDATVSDQEHPAGEPLDLPLPHDYDDEYDQVIAAVGDPSGEWTWSNRPEDLDGWLDLAVGEHTPPSLVVPGEAFPDPDALYGVVAVGLVRAGDDATRSSNLRSRLSGFTTGSGFALPVVTGP